MSIVTRRRFLQYAAASGVLASAPLFAQLGSPNRKVGVALLGLGGYSKNKLAPALEMTKHCYLAGIVSGTPSKIPEWQKRYGIKEANVYSYETFEKIADNKEIDVVYIVVPTGLHAKYAIAAANAGKHVWCEKPMAMNVAECEAIIEACKRNKVRLSIGYRLQHEPNTQTVMEYAKSKPFGEIVSVDALAGYGGRGSGKDWRFDAELGGGALYDMGVYTINGMRYATGMEPVKVLSATQTIPNEVDVTTEYELLFPGGLKGHGKTSVVEKFNRLRVECKEGWYELEPMSGMEGVKGRTSDGTLLDKPIDNQQARQMDNEALAILDDKPVLVPGEEGLKDIRIVQAIMESHRTGKVVDII